MRNKIISIYALAVILGILTGIMGSLFQMTIAGVNYGLKQGFIYVGSKGLPVGFLSALVSMIFVYLAWWMVKRIAPEASGSGVQEIEGTLLQQRGILWKRLLPVKFLGGVLAISAKMVVGREGPTIQMGGNLGAMLGDFFHLKRKRCNALIAAGAAAGLATAFNAPLAGVLFVLEEMRDEFNFSFTNFKTVAICCVMATITLHLIIGSHPAISMTVFELPSLSSLWLFFLFGIIVGLVGLVFNITLMKSLYRLDKIGPIGRRVYVLMIGLLVGYLAYRYPEAVGGGYNIIESSLTMNPTLPILSLLFLVRFMVTLLCYNTGVPGGIFAPMLALGTLLGLGASQIIGWFSMDVSIHPGMFAVAGMGALFSASVRAPITGIILVLEMTQNYSLLLPLMITCLTSTTVVQLAGNPPIYTQFLRRVIKRDDAATAH